MTKPAAAALILLGATFMSFVGLLMRVLESADAFQIMAYRSISLAAIVLLVVCLRRRVWPVAVFRSLDRNDFYMGMSLAVGFVTYVLAMLNTSVASTLFILSASPLFAAILAWIWVGERPLAITIVCMGLAMAGVGFMVQGGIDLGRTTGNAFAFVAAFAFAMMLTFARRSGKTDVLGGTFLAGVFTVLMGAIAAFSIGTGLAVSAYDFWVMLFMGGFTIGIGITFVTWGTGYIPAAEAGLLVLLESVLGPIWVWLLVNEAMTFNEIVGGGVVLMAVALQALAVARVSRRNKRQGLAH